MRSERVGLKSRMTSGAGGAAAWEMPVGAEVADGHVERDERQIRITIKDQGAGFDWRPYLEPDPNRVFDTHGRGITIARRLSFDDLQYRDPGNEVVAFIDLL